MIRYLHLLFLAVACNSFLISCSQNSGKRFQKEINEFKEHDKKNFPPKNAILFVGSSSFTKWTDVQDYFPGYTIVNRGFGGSVLKDVIGYADEIIIPYHPGQVVIYCGDNDIADGARATEVYQRFIELFNIIRAKLPNAGIVYVSIKPSPSRVKLMPVAEEANAMIRQFLSTYPETGYVDIFHPMLNPDGKPKPEIFLEDSLHMNAQGYRIWKQAIAPYLSRH
ncbi:MAG: G-D-S-L family lipolytic protein [Chitinophagaceae bacterium]|nr:G-D-S-L family lipolytic protein [Chitinophagaceae bacterium]